jgi:hypothetical protein
MAIAAGEYATDSYGFERLLDAGDGLGVHPHPWRWDPGRGTWIEDLADASYVRECLEGSVAAFRDATRRTPLLRFGDGFLDDGLVAVADALGIRYDPDPRPDAELSLSHDEYIRGVRRLHDIGFPVERTAEEAWPHFRGWRVNYEQVALAIGDRIVATPGPWAGKRVALGDEVIPTKRPVDRTPDEPEGTKYTKPGSYEER